MNCNTNQDYDEAAKLEFKRQVEEGLRDLAEGRTISHEELKQRVKEWRQLRRA